MDLEVVIGLEIHIKLQTKSKMFCFCDNSGEDKPPNTTICPICLGYPGTLPIPNLKAIEWALKAAMALNCEILEESKFDRKHYFYPDLPKNYQISQYDQPIGKNGYILINIAGKEFKIHIERIHLEEDAAKLIHPENKNYSLIDFNRAGSPLLEIVTKPEIRTPKQAGEVLRELRLIMREIGISSADMEKGQLRCDANISLRPKGEKKFYPKTEIKNLNSFKSVEKALEYEIKRQKKLWEAGNPPKFNSTRGWNEIKMITEIQREKEEASDYRYFPEPDIPPLKLKIIANNISLPELPYQRRMRFIAEYGFSYADAKILSSDKYLSFFVEKTISELKAWLISLEIESGTEEEIWEKNKKTLSKITGNWIINKLGALVKSYNVLWKNLKITPENFAEFIALIFEQKISSRIAQDILEVMFKTGADPSHIIESKGLEKIEKEEDLLPIIEKIIEENPKAVQDYKKGKHTALKFFIGQIMRQTKGKADPKIAEKMIKKILCKN